MKNILKIMTMVVLSTLTAYSYNESQDIGLGEYVFTDEIRESREIQSTRAEALVNLRMMQYGLPDPHNEKELVDRLLNLEKFMMKNRAMMKKKNKWVFKNQPIVLSALWQISKVGVGADKNDNELRKNFVMWLRKRFVPVLSAHLDARTALGYSVTRNTLGSNLPKAQEDMISKAHIRQYLNIAVTNLEGSAVYTDRNNPFKRHGVPRILKKPKSIYSKVKRLIQEY